MKAWEKNIRRVVPYVPGEQPNRPDMIKLNTNENPYPPAPGVQKRMDEFQMGTLRLYPDPESSRLVNVLADYYHVGKDQVFVGVGSDDVLSVAFLTFFSGDKPILFPDITYSFYDVWADVYRIPYECQALDENFRIRREDYYRENGGIIFANPNAPTSIAEPLEFVEDIVAHNQSSIVIVDEAYVDFGAKTALPLLEKYENLVVVQTFSKSRSMAGMRIGYALAGPKLIKAMNDVKYSINSYTMNQTSLAYGVEAVKDDDYFKEITARIIKTRQWSQEELEKLGFCCLDSASNFLFATHRTLPAKEIFEKLRQKNIFVRYFNKPRIDNYLRITIGTDEQMQKLMEALKGIVKE